MVTKEKDEELALFLELRRREKEKERSNLVAGFPVTMDAPLGIKGGIPPLTQMGPHRRTAAEKFLDSENDKSDYDWLITPPGTPLVPSTTEMETQKTARPTALKSRLTNIQEVPPPRTSGPAKPIVTAGSNRRSSSTGASKPTSRPSTPTSRPTLPSSRPAAPRSSTPTPRPTLSSSTKPAAAASGARSSTPTKTSSRASTPTASRHSLPSSRSASRSSTPSRPRSSTPSSRSSSVTKSAASLAPSKNPAPPSSRGSSPTVKPRPWKPNEMPGFSHDAPPNLKTSLPERPASATRGRPGARSSSTAAAAVANGRPRQQSCSPARVRTSTHGSGPVGTKLPVSIKSSRSSQMYDGGEDLNPGLMGTQMVERVVNMRKLAPPKHDDYRSSQSNSAGNLGRSLSKKSLDMALRHMDIRRSITGNLRPLMTNIPASSMYSVRSAGGSTRSRTTVSASESPHATSSNASSSEPSVSNAFFADGLEAEENEFFTSEKGNSSPTSQVSSCR